MACNVMRASDQLSRGTAQIHRTFIGIRRRTTVIQSKDGGWVHAHHDVTTVSGIGQSVDPAHAAACMNAVGVQTGRSAHANKQGLSAGTSCNS